MRINASENMYDSFKIVIAMATECSSRYKSFCSYCMSIYRLYVCMDIVRIIWKKFKVWLADEDCLLFVGISHDLINIGKRIHCIILLTSVGGTLWQLWPKQINCGRRSTDSGGIKKLNKIGFPGRWVRRPETSAGLTINRNLCGRHLTPQHNPPLPSCITR